MGFFLDLSLWFLSSKTLAISLTFSSSVSLFHSWTWRALGPNRSCPPTSITRSLSLSRWGRDTVGSSSTNRRRNMCKCVKSSVAVTPESCAMIWASRAIELALWKRSSMTEISFWILFLAAESRKNSRTFCWKLYTDTIEVADIVAVWAARAAKASSQEELFEMAASGTSGTAVERGGRSMRGDVECKSQRFGIAEGIFWVVGNSLGIKDLSHGFFTVGGGHFSLVPALGGGPCWYRPRVRLMTLEWELWGGHWRIIFSFFFFASFEETALCGNGSSVFGRVDETLMSGGSSVWDNMRVVRSW